MSYTPSTDFLALMRRTASGVTLARMPGLDFTVSALSRSGLFYVFEGQTAPAVNQATTVWVKPAVPSWTAECTVWLWNVETDAYELATPALWAALLSPAGIYAQGQTLVFNTRADVAATVVLDTAQSLLIVRYSAGYPVAPATYIPGTAAGPGAFQDAGGRWWQLDLTGNENVFWFGARGNGVADDTVAFQNNALFAPSINVPDGTFKLTEAVAVTGYGAGVVGNGRGRSIIVISSTTESAIVLSAVSQPNISGLQIRRDPATVPVAGAYGIDASQGTGNQGAIEDILLDGHYVGIILGATDSGRVSDVTVQNCLSDGVLMTPAGTNFGMQWQLNNVLSVQNGGNGVRVLSTINVPQLTMGVWRAVQTFANSGRGLSAEGLLSGPIQGLRVYDGFFGSDGTDEIYLDTYNTGDNVHLFSGVYIESCGLEATGPGLGTPATHTGRGFNVTANNTMVQLVNPIVKTNSQEGIRSSAAQIIINGGYVGDNGFASLGTYAGIRIDAGSVSMTGGRVSDISPFQYQKYAFLLAAGTDNHVIEGVDVRNFVTSAISNLSTGVNSRFVNNPGYNPVGQSVSVPGASPWTYRAGPAPETVYVYGGTISTIALQPSLLLLIPGAGLNTLQLGPNEAFTMTYTVAPTVVKSVH